MIYSKSEIKRLIKENPEKTPDEIITEILDAGNTIEGMIARGLPGPQGPEGKIGPKGDTIVGPPGLAGKDGRDGRDGRDGEDGKDGRDGKDGSSDSGAQIIEKINSEKELKIDASRIANLPEAKTEIIDRTIHIPSTETPIRGGTNVTVTKDTFGNWLISSSGGGMNVETPSGTVDASNTIFSVSNTPKMVIGDGISYFDGAGYSYSGGTITMVSPPASYIRSIY